MFGSIIALNRKVDVELAQTIMESYSRFGKARGASGFFAEVIIAPDAFSNTKSGKGISWGISMGSYGKWPHLVRYDCDLAREKTGRSSR